MANTQKPEVSEEALKNASHLWSSFTKFLAIGTAGTIILVIILAIITL